MRQNSLYVCARRQHRDPGGEDCEQAGRKDKKKEDNAKEEEEEEGEEDDESDSDEDEDEVIPESPWHRLIQV